MSSSHPHSLNSDFTTSTVRQQGIAQETIDSTSTWNGGSHAHAIELTRENTTQTEEIRAELIANGFLIDREGNVTWSEDHPLHPRNWAVKRKIYDTGIMFTFELYATAVGNTGVCLLHVEPKRGTLR